MAGIWAGLKAGTLSRSSTCVLEPKDFAASPGGKQGAGSEVWRPRGMPTLQEKDYLAPGVLVFEGRLTGLG